MSPKSTRLPQQFSMYPKRTPKQAKEAEQTKKLLAQQQREQLKTLIAQKYQNKYPYRAAQSVQEKVNGFFDSNQGVTTERLRELDTKLTKSESKHESVNAANAERDDISVKSGASRMSGATDFANSDKLSEKKDTRVLDLMLTSKRVTTKKYKNEEEEWADIYKHNQQVYQADAEIVKDRKKFEKIKFKGDLDDLVELKKEKRQREIYEKELDHQRIMYDLSKEEKKEQKKAALERAKINFEKEMRDKQIKEIKAQRRQDLREEKQLDAYIIKRIREEQAEDERVAKRRKEEDQAEFRKILRDNEEKRQRLNEENARERKEEIRLIEEQCRLIEERERQRDEEARAKDRRIREQIELGKKLVGKPSDERERRQEMKVQRWADKKEEEELQEELKEKHLAYERRLENKAYLLKQQHEKSLRQLQQKQERGEQAKIWRNSSEKFLDYEKEKVEVRKVEMQKYASVLKKQMNEKFEERRITDKLFDLRMSLHEKKLSQKAI